MQLSRWRLSGKTADGVPTIVGTEKKPPLWACRLFLGLGIAEGAGALALFFASLFYHSGILIGAMAMAGGAAALTGIGWWLLRLRGRIDSLISRKEVAAFLGVPETEVRRVLAERRIRAKYNINGDDHFASEELGDAGLLLRSAERPAVEYERELLRPAGNAPGNADKDQLLRASGAAADSELPQKHSKLAPQPNEATQHPLTVRNPN